MKNPYDLLEIDESAGDTEVKSAYLAMVRRFPPDTFPEKFKEIKAAYERINTKANRIAYRLFTVDEPDLDDLFHCLLVPDGKRIDAQTLIKIFSNTALEALKQKS